MATFKEFMSMKLVDMCVPEKRFKDVKPFCDTCGIANCERSSGYKASVYFWKEYNEMIKINEFLDRVRKPKKFQVRYSYSSSKFI